MNKEKKKNEIFLIENNKLIIKNYSFLQRTNKLKYNSFKYLKKKYLYIFIILYAFYALTFIKREFIYHKLNHIHIAMSLNDNYIYIIMVSITSILLNANNNTFIHIHLLIGNDITIENQNKISSLKRLNNNINILFYNVGNIFNGWISRRERITVATFYRSIIAELIRNVDKVFSMLNKNIYIFQYSFLNSISIRTNNISTI